MNSDIAKCFNDSLDRCTKKDGFFERFYEIFMESSPVIREKFEKTDLNRQRRMLHLSLYLISMLEYQTPEADAHMARIAKIHSQKGLNILPTMYDNWLDCLLKTVKEYDPLYTQDVDHAWRDALLKGIKFMKEHYI